MFTSKLFLFRKQALPNKAKESYFHCRGSAYRSLLLSFN